MAKYGNRRVVIVVILLFIITGGYLLYNNYLYKDARNIAGEQPAFTVNATQLLAEYQEGTGAATAKYLNKTLAVQGKVTSVNDSLVIIDSAVFCAFTGIKEVYVDETITVKGRCIGYDEIFGEVKLDQCTLTN
ncbi:hypothetical protein KJK34_12225 [Flavobacterium sp. D11R37]|uniref:OB-fold protein n=1 Tax=Flavobacterium coralii TaxID=2838017 RepID=UPI001CA5FD9E|nr:hypothetical protein [Flavobacterium coralii]MBY8963521.1 hypothetical protein [Flavobacterium coralii]